MSFLKAFLFGFLALIVSNLLLVVILYASFGNFSTIIGIFTGDLTSLVYHLFCSMGHAIWLTIELIAYHITNDNLFYIFLNFIIIIAPLIAAIVVGRLSEKRIHSFIAVLLISIISMIVSMILMNMSFSYQIIIASTTLGSGALFVVFFGSLLNGVIFGLLAFFTTKK
jgi:hypothetical protein